MKITAVKKGSQADKQDLRAGDKIVAVNNGPARDFIDIMFYGSEQDVRLTVHRGTYEFIVVLNGEEDFGITFESMEIKQCGNHCMFCFIDQNPPGMRNEIYIKDEDYRFSFLYGNYVTLTNLRDFDLQRIVSQRLSPLYVSVHATDLETRMKLLGITKDDHLIENMERLLAAGIKMHCQVVVCPGINDGDILEQTIRDLHSMSMNIVSLAIVPVGLTRHREKLPVIKAVADEDARTIIETVNMFHDSFADQTDTGFVYCADELYLLAGLDIPPPEYYDDFPQIENGVGMLRDFLESISNLEQRLREGVKRTGNFVFVTGVSMAPYIEEFSHRISEIHGITARTVAVDNRFFGEMVTVSGLLTGNDILSALEGIKSDETVFLPPNCLNDSGVFLDDMNPADLSKALGVKVMNGDYDPLKLFT